jgi:riboflavin biosynthesis pyrimidine reductase
MVSSLDGSTVVDDRSAALSNPVDAEVLHTLRDLADLLIVGAATVRVEGYGPPRKAGQRVGVVSRTGDVPTDTDLFRSGAGFLILPEDAPPVEVAAVRGGRGAIDFAAVLAQLDVDYVQAEGGATLNAALAEQDVLDPTISPQLVGGAGPRLTAGAGPVIRPMNLAMLAEDQGFLFTRYVRAR